MDHVQNLVNVVVDPVRNSLGVKATNKYLQIPLHAMANNPNPDFIQELMFEEHGTKVLITDPQADRYLAEHKKRKLQQQYPAWFEENQQKY